MAETSNARLIRIAGYLLASSTEKRDNSEIAWIGSTKQRYDATKFKLIYWYWHWQLFSESIQQGKICIIYLSTEVCFEILLYLRIIDITRLSFVLRRMHTAIYSSKQCKKYRELSSLIIDKVELYEWFMKRLDKLIDRFSFSFIFVNCLFLRYQLEPLKNEFCITNVLSHLLFCNRSPNSISQCRLCSHLFAEDANDFISSIKYHFSLIFTDNKIFSKEIELLFVQSRRMGLNFNILFCLERLTNLLILNRFALWIFWL